MKTAISVPDEVFRLATRYAKRLGISRSELFTQQFVAEHRSLEIRASYDRAFGPAAGDDDAGDFRRSGVERALLNVEW